jgi:hypothetical protein
MERDDDTRGILQSRSLLRGRVGVPRNGGSGHVADMCTFAPSGPVDLALNLLTPVDATLPREDRKLTARAPGTQGRRSSKDWL